MINIVFVLKFCWQPIKGLTCQQIDAKIQSFHVNDLKKDIFSGYHIESKVFYLNCF